MKIHTRIIAPIVILIAWGGVALAEGHVYDCNIEAVAEFATGEMIDGSGKDEFGVMTLDWVHDDGHEILFEATDLEDIECRLNGATTADILGVGTLNSVPGFPFFIEIADNRGPADAITLTASYHRTPTHRTDGVASFSPPRPIVVPVEITVLVGGSGSGKVKLIMDDIDCRYEGTGSTYAFSRCEDSIGNVFTPGDSVAVSNALLRIQQADRSFDLTVIEVDIGGPYPPGTPDFYSIVIGDPSGSPIYNFSGFVDNSGDIFIDLIRPSP